MSSTKIAFSPMATWLMCVKSLSRVRLFVTPWTVAHQAPLSVGFSRQEYWSGLLFPTPGESSWPRNWTGLSCIAGGFFTNWTVREALTCSKVSSCNEGDLGSIPGSGRSPGEGNGNPLQYSCLENPMDRGARWATVHGVTKSRTRLSDFTHSFTQDVLS